MNKIGECLQIGDVAGVYYQCGKKTSKLLIYGIGAPNVPDNGSLPEALEATKYEFDAFVPDYIGFGRSKGKFTPHNCIKTFLVLYEKFKNGTNAINLYSQKEIFLRYKHLVFAGRSLGGAYIPLLPKYNKSINEICVVFGALNQSRQGEMKGEETNEEFLDALSLSGYKYLYRGIDRKIWRHHLDDLDSLSPMDNVKYLTKAKIFIAHGINDECINYQKSIDYYNKLIQCFPKNKSNFKLKIYEKGAHDNQTAVNAVKDFLRWIDMGKSNKIN
jgi:hypothetical protein